MRPKELKKMATAPVFKSYDELQQDRDHANYAAACEAGCAEIFRDREFAVIVPSIASKKEIISFCQRYTGMTGTVPSLFIMREAKKHNPAAFHDAFQGVMRSISEQRTDLILEIVVLLASGGNMSEADVLNEKARLSNGFTLEALRRRLEQVRTAQRLGGLCKKRGLEAVKAERAEMRGDNVPQVVALLPPEHTAQSLKILARKNYPAFKKLVAQFGEQVTARLNGR
jgi:hypothetical protein